MEIPPQLVSNPHYAWTKQVAHYSPLLNVVTLGVPLCLVALVETIVEVAKYSGFFASQNQRVFRADHMAQPKGLDKKKIVYIAAATAGVLLAAYIAYRFYPSSEIVKEDFVKHYTDIEQCPSLEKYIAHQDFSLPTMRTLFGSERDLTLTEARFSLYEDLKNEFKTIAQSHPDYKGSYTETIARDISTLRDTAREYARERGSWWAHYFLSIFESRGQGFEYFWNKYDGDPNKVIEGAMRSNARFDSPVLLGFADHYLPPIVKLTGVITAIGFFLWIHNVYNKTARGESAIA